MKYYVGIGSCGEVIIADKSSNKHVSIVGLSGMGKSVRLTEMERKIVEQGGTVLAFDLNGTHYQMEDSICNHIDVLNDGNGTEVCSGICL